MDVPTVYVDLRIPPTYVYLCIYSGVQHTQKNMRLCAQYWLYGASIVVYLRVKREKNPRMSNDRKYANVVNTVPGNG